MTFTYDHKSCRGSNFAESICYDHIIRAIPRYPQVHEEELISALSELNELIGLAKIKEAVFGQIAYALMLLDNPILNKNKYMLHTLITGPPGVGKSNLAHILGKIWAALGIVGRKAIGRSDLTKDQDTIYHISRNADFISNKIYAIRNLLPEESIALSEQIPKESIALSEQIPKETVALSEQIPKETVALSEQIPKETVALSEQIPKESIALSEQIPKETVALSEQISGEILEMEGPDNQNIFLDTGAVLTKEKQIITLLDWIDDICKDTVELSKYVRDLLVDEKKPIKFKKVTRADLVGQWQGHTAEQTRNILTEALGGVLFIDEAYQLMTSRDDSGDNFGAECLTTINEFMSEHPDELIIIFSGYEDTMEETIFRVQPGLKRRFVWCFNIEPYVPEELASIIIKQATDDGWKLTEEVTAEWLRNLISTNISYFKNYGGDTSRLIFYTAINHASCRILNPDLEKGVFTRKMFLAGLEQLKNNNKESQPPPQMFG
ncbi:AAA family ATPase [uncultured virus]|nr:AAA family ATPase [uncultured virus]